VSQSIAEATRELIEYKQALIHIKKGVDEDGKTVKGEVKVFKPKKEIARRPSFLAEYRYGQNSKDLFVGRAEQLALIEDKLSDICIGDDPQAQDEASAVNRRASAPNTIVDTKSGVIVVEAGAGM